MQNNESSGVFDNALTAADKPTITRFSSWATSKHCRTVELVTSSAVAVIVISVMVKGLDELVESVAQLCVTIFFKTIFSNVDNRVAILIHE